jgi:tRNA threonylcarbamoyladenosine biosynthesis protein TsaB
MTCLLAIETSQRHGSIALDDGTGEVQVEPLSTDRRIDDDLMAAIQRLCHRARVKPSDLDAVGLSIGPGSFTGLRIAVSTAKMLAETLGLAIVPVPSAHIAAEPLVEQGTVLVALSCKGDTFWATWLCRSGQHLVESAPAGLVTDETVDLGPLTAILADQHLPDRCRRRIEAARIPIVEPVFDPVACAAIAQRRLAQGMVTDQLSLGPIYARRPEAVLLAERRAGRPDARR